MPDLSVIIVSWNTRDLLAECLHFLYASVTDVEYDVWVVDNASTDGTVDSVKSAFPWVKLLVLSENVGFARANNRGIAASQGRYVLLLNSDAFATPGAIESMVRLADAKPSAAVVGARLLNPDGTFQASHTPFPTLGQELLVLSGLGRLIFGSWYPSRGPQEDRPRTADYVEGACMLVRRKAIDQVGGLDEGYFMYAEEVDWCFEMKKAGWEVWYQPAAQLVHIGGGSSKHRRPEREADLYRSRVRFFKKHFGSGAASLLKVMIYAFTGAKVGLHWLLSWISGGRWGRSVVSLRYLAARMREA